MLTHGGDLGSLERYRQIGISKIVADCNVSVAEMTGEDGELVAGL